MNSLEKNFDFWDQLLPRKNKHLIKKSIEFCKAYRRKISNGFFFRFFFFVFRGVIFFQKEIFSADFCCLKLFLHSAISTEKIHWHYWFFFSIWVFFDEHLQITGLQGKGEGISLTLHYHFHTSHRQSDISWEITGESSPLRIASGLTRTRNLWFPSASC